MFSSKHQVWVLFSALLVLSIHGVAAQTTTATLTGTVLDETQGVLPGVEITVTNVGTGATRTTISGDSGGYSIGDLLSGEYELEAQLPGFQTAVRSGIRLTVGSRAALEITLRVGEVSERVVVTGDAPLVDTQTSTLRGLVDQNTVAELPLNGRSFEQLAMLHAGVVAYYGQENAQGFGSTGSGQRMTISGARPDSNNFMLDGTNIAGSGGGTPGSVANGVNLGVEAILEFEILTSSFDATYGRNSGGVINIVSKSGTNELHGNVFYYHRNSALDAKNFFDQLDEDIPGFIRNQYGFSLGGPVIKDKIHLFGAFEGFRQRLGLSEVGVVPTANGRLGIGVGPGGSDLTVNPGVVRYLDLYPLPNGKLFPIATCLTGSEFTCDGTGEFVSSPSEVTHADYFSIKYDHQASDSDSFFVRYTFDEATRDRLEPTGKFEGVLFSRRQYVTIEHKHLFSAAALNTFRIGFNRSVQTEEDDLSEVTSELELVPGTSRFFLNFSSQVTGGTGTLSNLGPGGLDVYHWNSYQFGDDFHYTTGNHSIRVGAQFDVIRHNFSNATFQGGRYSFNSFSQFVQGISRIWEGYSAESNVFRSMEATVIGFYIQDEFRWRPNFVWNLGFRFETQTEPNERNGVQSALLSFSDTSITEGAPYYTQPGQVFHPRIGFAWDIQGNGKTSLRVGAGMFNDTLATGPAWITTSINSIPFTTVAALTNPSPLIFPNAFAAATGSRGSANDAINIFDAKLPTRIMWNVTLQRELDSNTVLTFAYTGAVGRHHMRNTEGNHAVPTGTLNGQPVWCTDPQAGCVSNIERTTADGNLLPRANTNFGWLLTTMTDANSSYNALQVNVRKRYSQGLQFLASYTWGHSIDQASQQWGSQGRNNPQNTTLIEDRKFDSGDSIFDIRHSFSFNSTYELPYGRGRQFGNNLSGVANQILGGWDINTIVVLSGGSPSTMITGFNRSQNVDTRSPDRPNLGSSSKNPNEGTSIGCAARGGPPAGTPLGTPDNWYDPCGLELPLWGTLGDLGRTTLRNPGTIGVDLGVSKHFALTEDVKMQFRAEFFNIGNRPNFAHAATAIFNSNGSIKGNAGRISRTVTTSRQIQFALKIIF